MVAGIPRRFLMFFASIRFVLYSAGERMPLTSFALFEDVYGRPLRANEFNGMRSPAEYNTNLRLAKNIRNLLGMPATMYLEVFNLFNQKIFNYNYLFSTANKIDLNDATMRYENFAFDDPLQGVLFWD